MHIFMFIIQVQDINTDGASDAEFFTIGSDVYLLITSELSNSGQTNVNSQLLLWNGVEFVASQYLNSNGARAAKAFTIGSDRYVAVVNYYDTAIASYELRSVYFCNFLFYKSCLFLFLCSSKFICVSFSNLGSWNSIFFFYIWI